MLSDGKIFSKFPFRFISLSASCITLSSCPDKSTDPELVDNEFQAGRKLLPELTRFSWFLRDGIPTRLKRSVIT